MKALPNLCSSQVLEVDPLALEAESLPPDMTKTDLAKWRANPETQWVFLSGFEGVGPDQRVDANNPAATQNAFIADYDQNISKEMVADMLRGNQVRFKPTLVCPTPGRGVRLIWMFEPPATGVSPHLMDEWLKLLAKQLAIARLLPGLDPCWENPSQYYDWRPDWPEFRGPQIGRSTIEGWRVKLAEQAKGLLSADVALPMEAVAAEVERRWPGRWCGEFKLGARGCRFWDGSASNETASVVRETGMTCYTGSQAFVSWSQIFGKDWVNQFQNNRVGEASQDVYFIGSGYLFKEGSEWHELRIEAARRRLSLRGLSLVPGKGEQMSEVDKVISSVELQNYLHGSAPIVYRREKVVRLDDGRRVLNTATAKMVVPGDPDGDWGNLREFFEELFYTDIQVKVWHSWVQRFALRAWSQNSKLLGHSMILLGDPNDGKTFLATDVLGYLFGGVADPAIMFEGTTHFNANLFEKGLWTNSDGLTVQRREERDRYTNLLKAFSANEKHSVHGKGLKSLDDIPWGGRILITGNLNANSMNLVPEETEAADDKFLLLRSHGRRNKWLEHSDIEKEAPSYLAWLLHRFKGGLDRDHRFGFKAWHNHDVLSQARVVTVTSSFLEAIAAMASEGASNSDFKDITATQLLAKMRETSLLADLKTSPERVGRDLTRLKETHPGLVKVRRLDGISRWSLDLEKVRSGGLSAPLS